MVAKSSRLQVQLIGFAVALTLSAQSGLGQSPKAAPEPNAQASEVRFPDTPAGHTVAALISAINSGNIETMRKFHSDHNGPEDNADQDMGFYERSGGITVRKVAKSSDFEIQLIVQEKKSGNWLSLSIQVESEPPFPVIMIRGEPVEPPK